MRKNLGNKNYFLPLPVLIIGTYDENGNANAMNAAWGGLYDMGKVYISLSEHKTTDNLRKTMAFTISFATKATKDISDYFGIVSGRNENKIKKANVHVEKSEFVNAPIIQEFPLTLECMVESFEDGDLIGVIKNVSVDEKYLNTDGSINIDEMDLITFDSVNNTYRLLGQTVGKAFSDGKNIQ